MRVLHLIETTGPGGAETVYVQVAAGLRRRGHTSLAVVHGGGWVADALASEGISPQIMPLGRTPDVGLLSRLGHLIRREGVDVIQTHLLTSAMYGALLGRALGVPVVSAFHGMNDFGRAGWRTALKLRALRFGDARIVFVSEALRRSSTATFRFRADRTSVVHNGVDCQEVAPGGSRAFRQELGVARDAIVVGALGNVRPAKDYQTFIRAAAELARRSHRWHFVIVGDPTHHEALYSELLALRKELDLDRRLTFAGFRNDIARVLGGMDVLACTSSSEGFSLSICQALAGGVPVVSTRCGGPEEILQDNVTGLLAPVGAPSDIAAAIQRVGLDATLRDRLVAGARRDVVSRFSLDTMIDGYEQVYRAELGRRAT
ncbi:MAG TPA: glycosyltransferase [Gemmatimonadaceae bacterium]|nr:glycosyltransferase [Gemmatimonadaceae bacterium]